MTAALLSLFLGSFGVQFFYMNQPKLGFACLILFLTGGATLIGFVVFLALLMIDDAKFQDLMAYDPLGKNKT